MRYLLDTCVLVDLLRKNQAAINAIVALGDHPAISPVTVLELHAGARTQREEKQIESLIGAFVLVDIEISAYRRAGQLLKHFRSSHSLDFADALIAATAEQHGLKLATLNVKHFPMFPKLKPPY